jgi:hypothetical protein
MPAADAFFASDYHEARARFELALEAFEQHVGRSFVRERHVIDREQDLSIDIAEMSPENPERVYVAVSGIHGIEGYAGSAIQQALLASVLPSLDLERCGLLLVHTLNPTGMLTRRRVNAANVDLNRNFDSGDHALYSSESGAYAKINCLLEPAAPCDTAWSARLRWLGGIARAVRRHGFAPLRQATLGGQYAFARGVFFGGSELQPETRAFQQRFEHVCARYSEVLLTDLHTGYGAWTQVSSLFARVDSSELHERIAAGVPDRGGRDHAYAARGDLVGWCEQASKRARPDGVFNGLVVELGTHGLGVIAQLQDLYTVVCENQVRHHGARSAQVRVAVQRAFERLFNPPDPTWRKRVVDASLQHIQGLLVARGFLV